MENMLLVEVLTIQYGTGITQNSVAVGWMMELMKMEELLPQPSL